MEENKRIADRWADEVFTQHQLDAVDELFAADFVDHDPLPGQGAGVVGYRQTVSAFLTAFPDLQARNEELLAEGDKVALRWTATGTHEGELMGIAPTGRRIHLKGVDIIRIRDGRIAERWGEFDTLGMLQQLGAA